jgi:hypothetical protein
VDPYSDSDSISFLVLPGLQWVESSVLSSIHRCEFRWNSGLF